MTSPFRRCIRLCLLFLCLLLPGLVSGMEARDTAMTALLPFLMLAIPFAFANLHRTLRRPGWTLYNLWAIGWAAGYGCLAFLKLRYQLGPLDVPVVEALSQTSPSEAQEYVLEAGVAGLGMAAAASVAAGVALATAMRAALMLPVPVPRKRLAGLAVAAVQLSVLATLHGNALIERANPFTLARIVHAEAGDLREQSLAMRASRAGVKDRLAAWAPRYEGPARSTLVLVIGESSNRWDWSLYGYSRRTNPQLEALGHDLLVFKDVVSSFGSTMPEMTRMMTVADHSGDHGWRDEPTVVNLAKAAGYRTFWLTNQSFPFAASLFGAESNVFRSVYQGRFGRHDASSDEKLLPELDAALADPAPRKFIVLHMLGSHPDYERRYPPERDVFGHVPDAVDDDMRDRWFWLRDKRAAYDNSILETDHVLARAIRHLQREGQAETSLLFVSDHAQDVGHLTGSWGHQFHLESGFTVPMLLWRGNQPPQAELASRPYQTDRLEWTLLGLLHIATSRDDRSADILSPDFKPWQRQLDGKDYVPGSSHRPADHMHVSGR